MKERPILFKGEMVRAILEGRKTQSRRLINMSELSADVPSPIVETLKFGSPGDYTYVRLGSTGRGRFRVGLNQYGAVFKLDANGKTTFGLKPGDFNFVCPYADGRTWRRQTTPSVPTNPDSGWGQTRYSPSAHG